MKKVVALFVCAVVLLGLVGCGAKSTSSQEPKTLEGYWERSNTESSLYGMVMRIEKTDKGYVGKTIELTDTARDAGFKTGESKLADIVEETTEADGKIKYSAKDLTKNTLFGDVRHIATEFWFDPDSPDEIKLLPVEDSDKDGWNSPTYRRIDYKE